MATSSLRLIRRPTLEHKIEKTRSSIYSDIRSELLPPPISIGGRSVAWVEREVDAVIEARIAGTDDDGVRALVRRLIAQRARSAA